ncbi:pyruvate formate lyase-activating protein [Candidatus Micrarchaeota archaeon]|nr:pyruvate formate lyase-activating protein [Candidatus Micrarchaeota archaeon]
MLKEAEKTRSPVVLKGRIHSIESMGALDGPGLRFVVFMQGCPLRCVYCQNIDATPQFGGTERTVDELMLEIEKCLPYLEKGGVTISGGEPLAQPEFVAELLKRCRAREIHTAIDTCLFAPRSSLEKVLPFTDLVMASVKQLDTKKHFALTGRGNEEILENIRFVAERKPLRLRYVVIPGYTDSKKDLEALADFASSLPNLECVELLPYNTLGKPKWEKLGLKYALEGVPIPTAAQMRSAEKILLKKKLKVLLGA